MPIMLNVGLSQKIGESNYGSRGASIHLEIELDSALVLEPDKLKDRIRQLFAMVRASLTDELQGGAHPSPAAAGPNPPTPVQGATTNGKSNGRAHGVRLATPPQIKKLQSLALEKKIDLDTLMRERCQVGQPQALTVRQASDLIDLLKAPFQPQTA